LGLASNNVAEYTGLIVGLQAASEIERGAYVEARLDSKLVVEQMSGRWKIKHEDMRRLALQAREVVRGIEAAGGRVELTWVPRADNGDADALSNQAMDGETVVWDAASDSAAPAASVAVADSASPMTGGGAETTERTEPVVEVRPDLGPPVRVILVRHGVTSFTTTGRLDGRGGSDPALTAEGRAQAAAAGRGVAEIADPADTVVITSALARGRETGRAVASALGLDAMGDDGWDEQAFGDWDGVSMGELMADHAEDLQRFRDDPAYARPGGESHEELARRVLAAFDRAVARGGTVVVATHRKPILVVLSHVLGLPHRSYWTLATAPASLTAIQLWADGNAQVAFVNRTAHLTA
jgi:probable phosphoglycerate mutase